jgi:hypothetical protein
MDVFASIYALQNQHEMTEVLLSQQSIDTTFTTPETLLYILMIWLLFLRYLCWNLTSESGRHWLDEMGEEGHTAFAYLVQDAVWYGMALFGGHAVEGMRLSSLFLVIMSKLEGLVELGRSWETI